MEVLWRLTKLSADASLAEQRMFLALQRTQKRQEHVFSAHLASVGLRVG